eukprot:5764280-Pyramimonas_sp.AAC.1
MPKIGVDEIPRHRPKQKGRHNAQSCREARADRLDLPCAPPRDAQNVPVERRWRRAAREAQRRPERSARSAASLMPSYAAAPRRALALLLCSLDGAG